MRPRGKPAGRPAPREGRRRLRMPPPKTRRAPAAAARGLARTARPTAPDPPCGVRRSSAGRQPRRARRGAHTRVPSALALPRCADSLDSTWRRMRSTTVVCAAAILTLRCGGWGGGGHARESVQLYVWNIGPFAGWPQEHRSGPREPGRGPCRPNPSHRRRAAR